MTDPKPPKRIFADAKVDAAAAKHVPSSPQTESEAYKLAFQAPTSCCVRTCVRCASSSSC